ADTARGALETEGLVAFIDFAADDFDVLHAIGEAVSRRCCASTPLHDLIGERHPSRRGAHLHRVTTGCQYAADELDPGARVEQHQIARRPRYVHIDETEVGGKRDYAGADLRHNTK